MDSVGFLWIRAVVLYDFQELFAEVLEFLLAYAVDSKEGVRGRGVICRHFLEGAVAEDYVGRDGAFAGEAGSEGAEFLE